MFPICMVYMATLDPLKVPHIFTYVSICLFLLSLHILIPKLNFPKFRLQNLIFNFKIPLFTFIYLIIIFVIIINPIILFIYLFQEIPSLHNFSKFQFPHLIFNFKNSNIHIHLFNYYFRLLLLFYLFIYLFLF